MHLHHTTPSSDRRRGSTLVVVMVIVVALSIIVAGLLTTMVTDKRINKSIAQLDEARNAAEGAAEAAAAEFDRRSRSFATLAASPLSGYTIPDTVISDLAVGNVVASSITFKAGNISPVPDMPSVIAPDDPFNASDPDRGKPVSIRLGYIYGKASAADPVTGAEITRYVSMLLQIRSQSWLNYGVFSNLDLEFHSGTTMDVWGPVHSNQNIYVTAGNGQTLEFHEAVTTSRQILRKYKYGGISVSHTGSVYFPRTSNATGSNLVTMSTSQDSRVSNFEDFARTRWRGYVQDISFDIQPIYPPGMPQYREDDYTTAGTNETLNHAWALIEPQLSTANVDDNVNHVYAGHKGLDVENLKVSAVAGLTIRVKDPATVTDFWNRTRLDNDHADFEPGFQLVFFVGEDSGRPLNRNNMPQRGSDGRPVEYIIPISADRMSVAQRNRLFAAVKLVEYRETGSGTNGNRDLAGTPFAAEDATDVATTTPTNRTWYPIYDRRQGYQHTSAANTNNNLGYRGAHHALHIDLGKFNDFLNAPEEDWNDVADTSKKLYDPGKSYSGVIYTQFPLEPYSGSILARRTTDHIRPARRATSASPGFALVLRNGQTLPALPPAPSLRDEGLVLGTNGPAYIMGHFNADGSSSTGSSTDPDPGHAEVPALIAADAVTILSANWSDDRFRLSAKQPLNSASFTEVSASIFAGVVPTRLNTSGNGSNNQWMGGLHNYVRFLENWSGSTYRYRGSIAMLYENEVSLQPWHQNNYTYWYQPPGRDVGYHVYFANGRMPPAWPPFMRTIRRITVDDIGEAEWNAGPPTPPKAAVK